MHTIPADYQTGADALADRVVLVTGAGGGIGRAVSEALAAHGATTVLCGRRQSSLEVTYDAIIGAGGPQPAIVSLDLASASPEQYAELAQRIAGELGRLDALIHCAGHMGGLTPFRDVSAEDWYRTLQVNLSAPYLLTQALLPLLSTSDAGRIVFTLDDPGRMLRAYWGAYGVSKAGDEALMRILADELESTPVRVAGVCPGPARTGLRARVWAAEEPGSVPEPGARAHAFLALADPAFEPEPGAVYSA